MNSKIFLLSAFLLIFSCKKQQDFLVEKDWLRISDRVKMQDNSESMKLISGKNEYEIPKNQLPLRKVIFLNSSLLGYVSVLGAEDRIAGVSSPEYIFSPKIRGLLDAGKIANVGNEQKYDVEKILSIKPDAVFTNRIENFGNTYELLRKNGIKVIFLDEYLEQKPLEKSAYLKVFGALLGKKKEADSIFQSINADYLACAAKVKNLKDKPGVIVNEIYGSQWFMSGGKTFAARLLADAGADYILKDNADERAVPLSFEEVLAKSQNAGFWVNAGNHGSKGNLLAANANYVKINPFRRGKVFAATAKEKGRANDFFESGVVRADLVLKDYIKIFHPEVLPSYRLVYMKELR